MIPSFLCGGSGMILMPSTECEQNPRFDRETGNLVKTDLVGAVLTCNHGFRFLDKKEVHITPTLCGMIILNL